jgi:hypothetical protein
MDPQTPPATPQDDVLRELSPLALREKMQQQAAGAVSRDDLLELAAQKPRSTLILPEQNVPDRVEVERAAGARFENAAAQPVAPVRPPVFPVAQPAAPERVVAPARETQVFVQKEAPKQVVQGPFPVAPMRPVTPAREEVVKVKPPREPRIRAPRVGGGIRPLPIILGLVGGVVFAVLVLFGLVLFRGARIPVLYMAWTKLSPNGIEVAKTATKQLTSEAYQLSAVTISLKKEVAVAVTTTESTTEESAVTPDSVPQPDELLEDDAEVIEEVESPAVYFSALTSKLTEARFSPEESRYAGDIALNTDTATTPFQVAVARSDGKFQAVFPLANTTTREVHAASVQKTILPTVLAPIPLDQLLGKVGAVQQYRGGRESVSYLYSITPASINDLFPAGSMLKNPQLSVLYPTRKAAYPSVYQFSAEVTLGAEVYQYSVQGTAAPAAGELSETLRQVDVSSEEKISVKDFIASLGFSPSLFPDVDAIDAEDPNTRSFEPLSPTGTSTTTIKAPITTTPALTADTPEARTRDAQRAADLTLLEKVLTEYAKRRGAYPISSKAAPFEQVQSSNALLSGLVPDFLISLPIDPVPLTFWYEYASDGTTYTLRSVAESPQTSGAKKGVAFYYLERSGTLTQSSTN